MCHPLSIFIDVFRYLYSLVVSIKDPRNAYENIRRLQMSAHITFGSIILTPACVNDIKVGVMKLINRVKK